jgi:maltose alpha-D-glucosyltransferase / alpha-amylase
LSCGAPADIVDVRTLSAEQSNTTVAADGAFVIKFFRRVRPGINPDAEISRFLTDVAGYQHTPPLVGSIELVRGDERAALAIVQRFVENQGDGWGLTGAYLDRFLEEYRLLAPGAVADPNQHAAYLLRMRQIGRRLAELHRALASSRSDPAFAPETIAPADLRAWMVDSAHLIERTFDDLQHRRGALPERARPVADALLARRAAVLSRVGELLPLDLAAEKIRHHGDFHLGQVLIVKDDVFIIDFEGEPERSMEERRRKAPAARDLAGLIRSIDYAATAALDRAAQASPEEAARLAPAVEEWRRQCVDAFRASYREHLGTARLWPREAAAAQRLLDFFILEKAVYEIGYELANRPSWIHVPLDGAWRLLFPSEGAVP